MAEEYYVLIVPGYGTDREAQGLKVHVHNVARCINKGYPNAVILSGGASQRATHPYENEATVMLKMLQPLLCHHPIFMMEFDALTSLDNMLNSARELRRVFPNGESITIGIPCERNRRFKMFLLAWLALPECRGRIHVKPAEWEHGLVPTLKQVASTIAEVLAFYWPWLADRFRESRRRRAERT